MHKKNTKIFYARSQAAWRKWLEKHHQTETSVWLVFHKKSSSKPSISWSQSVDEALCFGWIDSKKIKIDEETSHQFFSRRKPNSTWSKINKEKIENLIAKGLMKEAGLACIDIAKQNGSWTILDEVEALIIPADLSHALSQNPSAENYFLNVSKSVKKIMLSWLVFAKTTETRQKRINEIVESAAMGLKPKHMR